MMIHSFITMKSDYCNALFPALQNATAHMLTRTIKDLSNLNLVLGTPVASIFRKAPEVLFDILGLFLERHHQIQLPQRT